MFRETLPMGYLTIFSLSVAPKDAHMDVMMDYLFCIDEGIREILNSDGTTQNAAPWYEHEKHMQILSRKFPAYTFVLSGIGEEPEDMWKKFFTNGLMRQASARISYIFDDTGENAVE